MTSETKKTAIFGAAGVALAALAFLTAPRRVVPDAFLDRGEAFFPGFEDPNAATTLEVVDFDEGTASARPFKVAFEGGRWTIPSHHAYPADGKDRLAKTAAGVIGILKDDFRTDNVADHEACGVLDPLDEKATSLKGRGQRVTLRNATGGVLADFIVGKQPEGREGFRFVRIPGQKRVYVARMDADLSTRFEDWIEKDLLLVEKDKIQRVVLKDYSINETTGSLDQRDVVELRKREGQWTIDRSAPGKEMDNSKVMTLLTAIDELSIVGVRPKPEGLSAVLRRVEGSVGITQADMLSLQSKGYYFTRDGRLVSNEGEIQVETTEGLLYTLRFGEVVYGRGEAVTAGAGAEEKAGPGENRYLFITTEFDPRLITEPPRPRNLGFQGKPKEQWTDDDRANQALHEAHEEWRKGLGGGQRLADERTARFADWYYVISADSFGKIRLRRQDLLRAKRS